MPIRSAKTAPPVVLVCGDDDFAVAERAKQIYQGWCEQLGGFDHEIIDGAVAKSDEALKVIAQLREALLTLPFFGSGKAIWLRNCSFLGAERVASAKAVTEALASLAHELESLTRPHTGRVQLLISAPDCDRRRILPRVVEKIGAVEVCSGWSIEDARWIEQAERWVRRQVRTCKKEIADDALAELLGRVGPDQRTLSSEIEKLVLYVSDRCQIQLEDVQAVSIRNKFARAYALADAMGDRDLPRLLRCLDEEFWEMQFDKDKSEFGLLAGLVTKLRALIFAKEMLREGWLERVANYEQFKPQLSRVPADKLPADRRFNPLALHPYVLFKAHLQADNYTHAQLVRAMDLLLRCNQKLIYSGLDAALLLQQTLIEIVGAGLAQSAHATAKD